MSEIYKNILFSQSEYQQQLDYWTNQLEDDFSMLDFPFTQTPVCTCNLDFCHTTCTLPEELTDKIAKLTNGDNFTTYIVLLTVLKVTLFKYTSNLSISIGTPLFNPEDKEFYNDLIILKDEIKSNITFKELLLQVKDTVVNGYQNQDYPIEMILKKLGIQEAINQLLNVGMSMSGLQKKDDLLQRKFSLNFVFENTESGMDAVLHYIPQLISTSQAEEYINKYLWVLEQCMNHFDSKIEDITLLSEAEEIKILYQFNNTVCKRTDSNTIGTIFEHTSECFGDNIAVIAENGQKITYKELNEKSNQLGRVLISNGISKNDIVGISLEASVDMITAILAAIKIGAAYLPVEPSIPKERYDYISNDCGMKMLIAKKNVEYEFDIKENVIFLDDIEEKIASMDRTNLNISTDLDDLIYVIYTSGTTGVPKGVKVKHRGLSNYLSWFIKEANLSPADKTMLISSFAFDLGYTALYSSLLNGCELHVLKKEEYTDPNNLLQYIIANGITYVKTTPSLFRLMTGTELFKTGNGFNSMRLVVLGGEMIRLSDVEELHDIYPDVTVLNHYGPTETTIGVIAHKIDFNQYEEYKKLAVIGKPIDNVHVYILDKSRKPLPIGELGEIYIAGECLAEGYVNNMTLTKEKFVQNPFEENELMYRTSDKGRFTEDGSIQFLGRIDNQVKIRGYRVEPEEIKNVLNQYKDITDCLVVVKEDQENNKFICAYVVSDEYTVKDLRTFLKKQLPDYMIPSYFINIPKIPLTNNGKVNYKSLPAPSEMIDTGVEYVAPRNEIESAMVNAWQEILNVKKVGVLDDFFVLGGDSIKAIQVSTRLHNVGIQFDLKDLMQYPTINEVARKSIVVQLKSDQEEVPGLTCDQLSIDEVADLKSRYENPAKNLEIEDISDLIPMEEVMYNATTYGKGITPYFHYRTFTIENDINLELYNKTFNILIDKYDILRSVYDNSTSVGIVRIAYKHMPSEIHYEDVSNLSPEEAENYFQEFVLKDAEKGYDLAKENLTRVTIIKTGEERYRGVWSNHHLILDGWSKIILVREFMKYLNMLKENTPFELERGIPFSKYVKWYKNQDLKEVYHYFENMLDGYDVKKLVPLSKGAVVDDVYTQGNVNVVLNEELTSRLLKIAKIKKSTLSSILRGAWAIFLHKLNHTEDVVFGSIVSGRVSSIPDMERRVGSHINMIPVRIKCPADKSFEECIKMIQSQFLSSEKYAYFSLDAYKESAYKNVFDTALIVENYPIGTRMKEIYQGRDVVSDVTIFDQTHCNFCIFVTPFETTVLKFSYNTRRYSTELVEKIGACLEQIVNQIADNPKILIRDIAVDVSQVSNMPIMKE